jgi:hypothetical protein
VRRFLAAAFVVAIARDADPCSIVIPTNVLPASAPAPVNAHVWIRSPSRTGSWVLRAVGPVSADIPISKREWCPQFVEIVPQSTLPPSSRFELWVVEKEKPYLVASFGTGTATDTIAPPKPSFTSAVREVTGDSLCGPSESMTLAGGSPQPETLYAAWAADDKGTIPWSAAPSIVFSGSTFDTYRMCQSSGKLTFEGWKRIGIRAMDVAGNLGEALVLDVTQK